MSNKYFVCLFTTLLTLFSSISKANEELVTLNFVNADVREVISAISHISKKNFVVDQRVKGTIDIVSAKPVPAILGYDILLSALRLQGYAAVESAGVTKIVPEADAKLHIDTLSQGKGDRVITRVFILKYESATQLANVVRPMIGQYGVVSTLSSGNALIVTDYAGGVKRIEKLIDTLDRSNADSPIVIAINNASAIEVVNIINKLMPESTLSSQAGDENQRFVLVADSRSNSLLLRSTNPNHIVRVTQLAEKLDVPTSQLGNIHVVQLNNSDATKIAQTLRAVVSSDPSVGALIQADTTSNTVIITAAEPIFNNIRAVIDKLDVRRPQVFVEALIVEVSADKAAELGVQWQNLAGVNGSGTNIVGGTNFGTKGNIIGSSIDMTSVGQGLNIGVVKGTTNVPGIGNIVNLGMLAHALETDSKANILSAPNLMTLDNEEAKIVVGQNVPFITGQYAQNGTSTTASPFQTIERKDVGLTLKIKPQIMQGGAVKLQVFQEVSNVAPLAASSAGVITNKRSIESTILVDENQIVVLGGLIQDSVNEVQNKTPLLGDIPLLGHLFRYETRQHTKTNLMVFIRPYVMHQSDAYQKLSNNRLTQMNSEHGSENIPEPWAHPNKDQQ